MSRSDTDRYVTLSCSHIPQATALLQKLFPKLYESTFKTKWENSSKQGKSFIEGEGKTAWITGSCRQKLLMAQGEVFLWDLKLLNHVIQKLDFGLKQPQKNAIAELAQTANEVYRERKVSTSEQKFSEASKKVDAVISAFKKLDKGIKKKKVCRETIEVVEESKTLGNALYAQERYETAFELCTDAINLCKDSDVELLGTLYSNRAAILLRVEDGAIVDVNCDAKCAALHDAKIAVLLRPNWFRAHYRLGSCYLAQRKYNKAFKHFTIAVELDKGNKGCIEARDACEKSVNYEEDDYPTVEYPTHVLESNLEAARYMCKMSGIPVAEELADNPMDQFIKNSSDCQNAVWRAHWYVIGNKAPKNLPLAFRMYEQAVTQGSTEAMYHLGMMYRDGKGVRRDLKMAMKLFKQASNSYSKFYESLSVDVDNAEFNIGYMYEKGIGIRVDLEEAAAWYRKAVEHDSDEAAMLLAAFYEKGRGVEKNMKKAAQYWKLSAMRGYSQAMYSLAYHHYLVEERNAERALEWHRRAVAAGKNEIREFTVYFQAKANKLIAEFRFIEKDIVKWEKAGGLPHLSSNTKRLHRYLENELPDVLEFQGKSIHFHKRLFKIPEDRELKFNVKALKKYKNSKTAQKIIAALGHFQTASRILREEDDEKFVQFIHETAAAVRTWEDVIVWDEEELTDFMDRNENDVPKGNDDIDSHLVSLFNMDKDCKSSREIFGSSVKVYPEELYLRLAFCETLRNLGEFDNAIKAADQSLKKFPDDPDLLFDRAANLYLSFNDNSKIVFDAFDKFLAAAPPDHPKVPQAYYTMAIEVLKKNRKVDELKQYYEKGLEAEKSQLPCYLPYVCEQKNFLQSLICMKLEQDRPLVVETSDQEKLAFKLSDPRRAIIITGHRERFSNPIKTVADTLELMMINAMQTKKQRAPKTTSGAKFIAIEDLDPTLLKEYAGCAIRCTIIDDPYSNANLVYAVVEDEAGDVGHVSIDNSDRQIFRQLRYGRQIAIYNPLYKRDLDGKFIIRVDDVKSIVLESEEDLSRCRYCGKEGAAMKCGKCQKASYCSKDCQVSDWKLMKHSFVCLNS